MNCRQSVRHASLLLLVLAALACGAQPASIAPPMPATPQLLPDLPLPAGPILQVNAGADLQALLDAAEPGTILELAAGAVFTGPFVLPRKDGTAWITLRSAAVGNSALTAAGAFPARGERATPVHAAAMARLEAATGPVLLAAAGAHHYRFIGIEVTAGDSRTGRPVFLDALVVLGDSTAQRDDVPGHFEFERCYLHGDRELGARRGIVLNSASTTVRDSWLSGFMMRGEDSQALIGWSGPGPFRILNNYLEAAGENLMFGGADAALPGLVPADIEIRGNRFAKPLAWRSDAAEHDGSTWTIKNLLELKNARRVLIDGNLFEHNWVQAQNGFAVLFTVRNQQGSAPWSVVEDISFTNNLLRNIANGINILGRDDMQVSEPTRRILIGNNLVEALGGLGGQGHFLQVLDGVDQLTVRGNSVMNAGNILLVEGRSSHGFVFSDNVVQHNAYGIIGTGTGSGSATLQQYFTGAVLRNNIIVGGAAAAYPAGNRFPSVMPATAWSDATAGVDLAALCAALSVPDHPAHCR